MSPLSIDNYSKKRSTFRITFGKKECVLPTYSVLRLDGEVLRGVRGVSEIDFLMGLANALGADTARAKRASSQWSRIGPTADACMRILDQFDRNDQAEEHKD
jgi:hypothetical protein